MITSTETAVLHGAALTLLSLVAARLIIEEWGRLVKAYRKARGA